MTKVYYDMAELYRPLSRLGISPVVADAMELWQIAAVLQPTEDEAAAAGTSPPGTGELTGDALLEARMRAAQSGEPMPEARPMNDAVAEMFGATV